MSELSDIHRAAKRAAENEPLWLASVMRVEGSAYRRPGARLLFDAERVLAGCVSGGCLESDIVRRGPWLCRERPVCVRYEGGHDVEDDEPGRGTGCDGSVEVLIERVRRDSTFGVLELIDECLSLESRAALLTVFESRDLALPVGTRVAVNERGRVRAPVGSHSRLAALVRRAESALRDDTGPRQRGVRGDGFEALLEVIEPPPHLFVVGGGPDAVPLVEFATRVGLSVTVCETQARPVVRERFAGIAEVYLGSPSSLRERIAACRTPLAVVMSHHYPTDCEALGVLLESSAIYIGMLGPERRTRRMLNERYRTPSELLRLDPSRLRAPVGLDLGAETPEQIALAIVAEIQSVLGRARAMPLSERANRPIHDGTVDVVLARDAPLERTGTE